MILKIMRALFADYACTLPIMRTFFGFVLHIIGIRQWKVPPKSTQVSEGDYSANIRVNIHAQESKL